MNYSKTSSSSAFWLASLRRCGIVFFEIGVEVEIEIEVEIVALEEVLVYWSSPGVVKSGWVREGRVWRIYLEVVGRTSC